MTAAATTSTALVYEGVERGARDVVDCSADAPLLFSGMKIWFSRLVPQRQWLEENARQNGATIVSIDTEAHICVGDHARKNQAPGLYSYQYIENSIRKGQLEDLAHHAIGATSRIQRHVGSIVTGPKKSRTPFTEEDDQFLWNCMTPFVARAGRAGGNVIFQQIEAARPTHPYQAWRDRWLKYVRNQKRDVTEEIDLDNLIQPAQLAESVQAPQTKGIEVLEVEDQAGVQEEEKELEDNYEPTSFDDAVAKGLLWPNLPLIGTFTHADARNLFRAVLHIEETSDEYADKGWKAFATENEQHTEAEWRAYFRDLIVPEYHRRNGVMQIVETNDPEIVQNVPITQGIVEPSIAETQAATALNKLENGSCSHCFLGLDKDQTVDRRGNLYCQACATYLRTQSPRKPARRQQNHSVTTEAAPNGTHSETLRSPSPSKVQRPEPRKRTGAFGSQTNSQNSEGSIILARGDGDVSIEYASKLLRDSSRDAPRTPDNPLRRTHRDIRNRSHEQRASKRRRVSDKPLALEIPSTPDSEAADWDIANPASNEDNSRGEPVLPEPIRLGLNQEKVASRPQFSDSLQYSRISPNKRVAELKSGGVSSPLSIRLVSDNDMQPSSSPLKPRTREVPDSGSEDGSENDETTFETAPDTSHIWETAPNIIVHEAIRNEDENDEEEVLFGARILPRQSREIHMQVGSRWLFAGSIDEEESEPELALDSAPPSVYSEGEINESIEVDELNVFNQSEYADGDDPNLNEDIDETLSATILVKNEYANEPEQEAGPSPRISSRDSNHNEVQSNNYHSHPTEGLDNIDDWMIEQRQQHSPMPHLDEILILIVEATTLNFQLASEIVESAIDDYLASISLMRKRDRPTIVQWFRLPTNVKGCWTEADDESLLSRDLQLINKAGEKHGVANTRKRLEFLEEMLRG